MERDFRSLYATGTGEYSPDNPYLTGLNFQSLVSLGQERALFPSIDQYPSSVIGSVPESVASVDFYDRGKQVAHDNRVMKSYDFMEMEPRVKMPKYEHSPELTFPYGFVVPKHSVPASNAFYSSSFGQLPDLRSVEHGRNYNLALTQPSSSSRKQSISSSPTLQLQSPIADAYFLESLFRSFEFTNAAAAAAAPPVNQYPTPARNTAVEVARKRRYTLSEKTRSLQRLLPWDTKMDAATMFEEAHKYIRFLQAQISVLQSMPLASGAGTTNFSTDNPDVISFYGALGRLNRQQLLQVLVNSPVAQTVLYSKGLCIFSIEQLHLLTKIVERNLLMNHNPSGNQHH